jgi:response regulator RpfG family c-di-GMP phosphodiesterase
MSWFSKGPAFKLFLSAILHDIGKKNFSQEFLLKSPFLMTNTEFAKYKEHSTHGKDILINQCLPSDVVQAVYDHHENYNGSGFPNGLKKKHINPFARVIRIADDFCHYYYNSNETGRSANDIIQLMQEQKEFEYDPVFLVLF